MSERDDDLVELYRRLPRTEPPAALDAAVLAMARAAVRPRRPAWLAPVSAAAALVLAVGVGWQLRHEPLREVALPAPAPEPAEAVSEAETAVDQPRPTDLSAARIAAPEVNAAPVAPPEPTARPAPAPRYADRARLQIEDREAKRAVVAKPERPATPLAREPAPQKRILAAPPSQSAEAEALATAEPTPEPAPPPPPAPPAPPVAAAPPVPATPAPVSAAAIAEPVQRDEAVGGAVIDTALDLAAKFEAIRALRDAGRVDDAAAELARLREAEPGIEIPEDLRELLR